MTTLRNNNEKDTSWNYWREVRREETTIHETSKKQEVTKKCHERKKQRRRERESEEEMENAVRRFRKKKATGEDRLKNEVWINADGETKEKLRKNIERRETAKRMESRHNIPNS